VAIAFVSKGAAATNANQFPLFAKPAVVTSGNALVAIFSVNTITNTVTAVPTGWTLLASQEGITQGIWVYTKLATGAEPATYQWTMSATGSSWQGAVLQYSGVDTTTAPFNDGTATSQTGTNSTSHVCPTMTTLTDGAMVIGVVANAGIGTYTWSVMTEELDARQETGNSFGMSAADIIQTTAGATGTFTGTCSAMLDYASLTFALKQAVAGGAVGIPDLAMAPLGRAA